MSKFCLRRIIAHRWLLSGQYQHKEFPILHSDAGLPWWLSGEQSACQHRRHGLIPDPGRSHIPRRDQVRAPKSENSLFSDARGSPGTTSREEPADQLQKKPADHSWRGSLGTTAREEARVPQPERSPQTNYRRCPQTTAREDARTSQLERKPGHHSQRGSLGTRAREEARAPQLKNPGQQQIPSTSKMNQ